MEMSGLPSHCPNCGLIFVSTLFGIENTKNVTIRNNVGLQCPRCRGMAHPLEGTFDFVGNAIRVIKAPPKTIAILSVLQEALNEVQKGVPAAEVISKIEKASPAFASALKEKTARAGPSILATVLLSLLATCSMNMNTTATLNWNQLVDQVHVYQTEKEPYPGLGQSVPNASEPETKPKISRQQRRYKERQTKKQQQPPEQRSPKKPTR